MGAQQKRKTALESSAGAASRAEHPYVDVDEARRTQRRGGPDVHVRVSGRKRRFGHYITADEPGMFSSQNEQDNRNYARHARLLCSDLR